MRARELSALMRKLEKLTPSQRRRVVAGLTGAEHKATAMMAIESGAGRRGCPHCHGGHVVKNGMAGGLQRFKCRACAKTFNALTGTPLAHLHLRGKWVGQVEAMRDGLSLKQVEARLGTAHDTAFRWRHRFLATPKVVARDRSGATADFVLDADDAVHVAAALKPILSADVILCTDGSKAMAAAAQTLGVAHHAVNLAAGIRVDGSWHIQNVNAYDSRLKEWMRHFKGVATKYLGSYLGWFRTIERPQGKCLQPTPFLALAATILPHP